MAEDILPGTGRGAATRSGVVEGVLHAAEHSRHAPSTSSAGPPPRAGEDIRTAACRLAGQSGAAFGWTPDVFWSATPAELAALVDALAGERAQGADRATLAQLMEAFPDG